MTKTVLILGGTGRFGRHATHAFTAGGWTVRQFNRAHGSLWDAAWGAQVIVNAWNMPPGLWRREALAAHERVIEVAAASGATVILPGNVYSYGSTMPSLLTADTAKRPDTVYGQVRHEIERAYQGGGVRTIVLRAGDFLDTQASGNWFDKMIAADVPKGRFVYPGALDVPHAWAFLPDLARAAVGLAEIRETLPTFADVPYAGLTLTGREMAAAIQRATGHQVVAKEMSWLPIQMVAPLWGLGRYLVAMRYLWNTPHALDAEPLRTLLPAHRDTGAGAALAAALAFQVHPDGHVAREADVSF